MTAVRIHPFVPGRRSDDDAQHPGLGSSDGAAIITGDLTTTNRACVLFKVEGIDAGDVVDATVTVGGQPLAAWDHRPLDIDRLPGHRNRLDIDSERDLAGAALGMSVGFLEHAEVEIRVRRGAVPVASDHTTLDVCDLRNLGTLYRLILDRLVVPDTAKQAAAAGVPDPGPAFHPWYPVLRIGSDKADLYTRALVGDIVDKQNNLSDPVWLLRVGIHLELLTCLGIIDAVRDEVGDLLDGDERARLDGLGEIRSRIDPDAWRAVWVERRIAFPTRGTPRTGPVSARNLLAKKRATLRFLHVHHDDLKRAIELAGPNRHNAQETWHRVFRDAERAVLRQTADAFPELTYLPAPVRELVLWQRHGFAEQRGLFPTACQQYRASMNAVADWAKQRGLMDHAGDECIPASVSLLDAHMNDPGQVAALQRADGYAARLDVAEPIETAEPTVAEVEALLSAVPILRMLSADEVHSLACAARPVMLGPAERVIVQGEEGTSLFLVADGTVEVLLRRDDGRDVFVETMGAGEVIGEMSLLTGERRVATVRALDGAVVYEIGDRQYGPVLRAHPEWLDELARIMEERLARRKTRLAEVDAAGLRDRIRRRFFSPRPASAG